MSLVIEKSLLFHTDVTSQFLWYWDEAGDEMAWRFFNSVDMTIIKLSKLPDLGRKRSFLNPALKGLRSCKVEAPFNRLLIFYSSNESKLLVWRLMHGARDLPRRLAEPLN